jgi:hypothetical protein
MADRARIKSGYKTLSPLSIQQYMECSTYASGAPAVGCEGNDVFTAMSSLQENKEYIDAAVEYDRQYSGKPSNTSDCVTRVNDNSRYGVKIEEAYNVSDPIPPTNPQKAIDDNIKNIKSHLYNEGPLVAVICVPPDFVDYDGTSIYDEPKGFDAHSSTNLHAVELIGWGVTLTGESYWVCRNSWGTSWPHNHKRGAGIGFFYIRRGHNTCLIEEHVAGCNVTLRNASKAPAGENDVYPGDLPIGHNFKQGVAVIALFALITAVVVVSKITSAVSILSLTDARYAKY